MTGEGLRRLLGFARRLDLEATFLTALGSAPDAVIASYKQSLPGSGCWTVTGSGGAASSHGGGAGLQATNVARYLSINAGGPAGTTYVNICVSGNSFGAAFFQHAYECPSSRVSRTTIRRPLREPFRHLAITVANVPAASWGG
jgi:hypothetical protein